MSNLFVKNIPSIKERTFKIRSKMSSSELNALQKEAFDDILDLFNKANQLQKTIYEMNLANHIESSCYTKRLQEALDKIKELEENYANLIKEENEYRSLTKYAYEAKTLDTGYDAIVDKNTNDIIAHIVNSTSKVRLYDETYDETVVPPSLQVYIGPDSFSDNANIYSIEDTNINNAFDGNEATTWIRKVITSTSIDEIDNEILIGLPEDIITTRLMNQIIIKPFPAGYIYILDIKYKSNGAWKTIPGFENHENCKEYTTTDIFGNTETYFAIRNASNLKFNFQDVQTNQIKIKIRQRNYEYDAENNRRIFYIGIKDIDVNYNIYTKDHSEFELTYEFPEKDRNIKIYDTEIIYNNSSISNPTYCVTKEYYYFDSDDNTHKIPSTCPFILNGHKVMVKFSIEGNQYTPNISACKIKYKLS